MANLTDADKVLRNDVGKSIASKLDDIADAIVQQGGGAHSLGQLSDVDIDTTTLAAGQSIVYNPTIQKFENGEVSTVAALDDLTDVSITSAQKGDSLRYDGNEWIAQPTTIEMTSAEWEAIADKQAWRNAHKNTHLVLTDTPNLNATAEDISYDGSAVTVKDKVDSKADSTDIAVTNSTLSVKTGVSITLARSQVWKSHGLAFVSCAFTANANIGQSTDILTTPSGYNALSLTDLVGTDNANNGKPFYISGNTITANGNLTSGASYFINGVFRTSV